MTTMIILTITALLDTLIYMAGTARRSANGQQSLITANGQQLNNNKMEL